MRHIMIAVTGLTLACIAAAAPAIAQQTSKPSQAARSEEAIRERKNAWTVGIATGQLDASYPRLAQDISKVLDDGENLRILPIMTHGAVTNVEDLLWLRGVDVAFTKSDSFEYYRTVKKVPNLQNRIHYIARLFGAELHILAPTHVTSLQELQGKKIAVGIAGSASNVTMPIVLEKLGLTAELLVIDQVIAIEMMRKGEVDAVARVGTKPMDTFTKLPPNSGFHLLPLPSLKLFDDIYTIGQLTNKDYPNIIPPDQTIDTISVSEVLAVFNWPKSSDRYRRVERFTEEFFAKFDNLHQAAFHPKWKDVNLAASLPGWSRFEVADRILQRTVQRKDEPPRKEARESEDILGRQGQAGRNQGGTDALFREFMAWRNRQ